MKIYCPFAYYKDRPEATMGFDYFDTFKAAKEFILRVKDRARYNELNIWGIDVFDRKQDQYTHHYILIYQDNIPIFELRRS